MPEFLNMTHIGLKMLMAKEEIDIVSQAEGIPVSMKYGKRDCLPCSMSCMTCSRSCLFHLMLLIGVLVTPHSLWPFTREQMLPTLHGPLWFPCTLSTPLSIVSSLNSPMFICLLPVPYLIHFYNIALKIEHYITSIFWHMGNLEKGMPIHSSILAWRISWAEEAGSLQCVGSRRIRHDWATNSTTIKSSLHSFNPPFHTLPFPLRFLILQTPHSHLSAQLCGFESIWWCSSIPCPLPPWYTTSTPYP